MRDEARARRVGGRVRRQARRLVDRQEEGVLKQDALGGQYERAVEGERARPEPFGRKPRLDVLAPPQGPPRRPDLETVNAHSAGGDERPDTRHRDLVRETRPEPGLQHVDEPKARLANRNAANESGLALQRVAHGPSVGAPTLRRPTFRPPRPPRHADYTSPVGEPPAGMTFGTSWWNRLDSRRKKPSVWNESASSSRS